MKKITLFVYTILFLPLNLTIDGSPFIKHNKPVDETPGGKSEVYENPTDFLKRRMKRKLEEKKREAASLEGTTEVALVKEKSTIQKENQEIKSREVKKECTVTPFMIKLLLAQGRIKELEKLLESQKEPTLTLLQEVQKAHNGKEGLKTRTTATLKKLEERKKLETVL